uniref:Uncharacterized protein n=1 Tax=virus sp. ctML55 TaxID=2827627 RepID=A0A8S5RHT8_9VIRU|nr:MAG TPA: hypothetical protein [virus sp. ctML55]
MFIVSYPKLNSSFNTLPILLNLILSSLVSFFPI